MEFLIILFVVSFLILALGAVYVKMEEIFLSEPLIAMVVGILLGPELLDLVDLEIARRHKVLEVTCQFTIAMALMATALRLPNKFLRENFKSQTILVLGGMLLMWIFSAAIMYFLFPFSIAECLLLGAIVTPTDPVVASTIVSGGKAAKYLPSSLRNTISFESGINDGLAFPIVIFGIFLYNFSGFPLQRWLAETVLYETVLCAVVAYLTGFIAGWCMHQAHKRGLMTPKAVLPFSLGLSLMLLSGLELLNMNGILAVFVGGLAFARIISKNEDIEEERVQEALERISLIPVFFIFGILIPWQDWFNLGWTAVALVVLILLWRRIPAFFILKPFIPQFRGKTKDVLLMGWFGPIGVAALYYAIMAEDKTFLKESWIIPSLLVFSSTLVHGITSLPFERWYYYKSGRNKQK